MKESVVRGNKRSFAEIISSLLDCLPGELIL